MSQSVVFSLLLPASLVLIMFGLGLSLRIADFAVAVLNPKPLIVALLCQVVLLPIVCFALVVVSGLSPALAMGMMLLAVSPGGSSAIIYTHLANGDTALSITLNVVNTAISLVTLPLVANFSMLYFYGSEVEIPLTLDKFAQLILLAALPAALGIAFRNRRPSAAERLERPVKVFAIAFLVGVIFYAVVTQFDVIVKWAPVVGLIGLIFNLCSLGVGYSIPMVFGLHPRQAIAIAMDIGVHNAAFVITLAMSEYFLNNAEMAVPPAIYALIAYVTASLAVVGYKRFKLV
ncbi:MAG: bile acid:sodium symporter family protein [Azonexus sp.]